MSTLTWKTEKELQQEIKTAETNFFGRKTGTFYGGGEKMRKLMLMATKVEMSSSEKKSEQRHIQHFLH